jgi:hypothetical protein
MLHYAFAEHPQTIPMVKSQHISVVLANMDAQWLRLRLPGWNEDATEKIYTRHKCVHRASLRNLDLDTGDFQLSRGTAYFYSCR